MLQLPRMHCSGRKVVRLGAQTSVAMLRWLQPGWLLNRGSSSLQVHSQCVCAYHTQSSRAPLLITLRVTAGMGTWNLQLRR